MLYSKSLLVIHFKDSSVCMSIPNSLIIPSSHLEKVVFKVMMSLFEEQQKPLSKAAAQLGLHFTKMAWTVENG